MDSALPSEGKGCEFESRRIHHLPIRGMSILQISYCPAMWSVFVCAKSGRIEWIGLVRNDFRRAILP